MADEAVKKYRKGSARPTLGRNALRAIGCIFVILAVAGYGMWAQVKQARALEEMQARATLDTRGQFLKDGTFEGSARSFGGMMTVAVTIENGYITAVEIVSTSDDNPYIGRVEDAMPFRIAYNQAFTLDEIDAVVGATVSSRGILNATNNALVDGGAIKGEKSGPAANSKTGAKSTTQLKEMAAKKRTEEKKEFYELSWHDQFGEEEEYYGRHDSSANVSGGFAGGV